MAIKKGAGDDLSTSKILMVAIDKDKNQLPLDSVEREILISYKKQNSIRLRHDEEEFLDKLERKRNPQLDALASEDASTHKEGSTIEDVVQTTPETKKDTKEEPSKRKIDAFKISTTNLSAALSKIQLRPTAKYSQKLHRNELSNYVKANAKNLGVDKQFENYQAFEEYFEANAYYFGKFLQATDNSGINNENLKRRGLEILIGEAPKKLICDEPGSVSIQKKRELVETLFKNMHINEEVALNDRVVKYYFDFFIGLTPGLFEDKNFMKECLAFITKRLTEAGLFEKIEDYQPTKGTVDGFRDVLIKDFHINPEIAGWIGIDNYNVIIHEYQAGLGRGEIDIRNTPDAQVSILKIIRDNTPESVLEAYYAQHSKDVDIFSNVLNDEELEEDLKSRNEAGTGVYRVGRDLSDKVEQAGEALKKSPSTSMIIEENKVAITFRKKSGSEVASITKPAQSSELKYDSGRLDFNKALRYALGEKDE